jgi:ATP-dependent Clp protease protease subunit
MRSTPKVPYRHKGTEFTSWMGIYDRMYRERILFVNQEIDDNFANQMISVFLYLESEDATKPVALYCNSPGGLLKSGMALYDTMRIMPFDIQTVNMGLNGDIAAFLVGAGTKGKRYSLPNARFSMRSPGIEPARDGEGRRVQRMVQATEMKLEVEEVLRDKARMIERLASFTGRPEEAIRADFERDFYLDAPEALEYGLIDKILQPKTPEKKRLWQAGD